MDELDKERINRKNMTGCRPLTENEVTEIKESFGGMYENRNRALFVLGINTGFRISELLSIKIKDVWNGSRVLDYVTVQRGFMKKKEKGRTVKLNRTAKEILKAWIQEMPDRFSGEITGDDYLFRSRKGNAISRQQAHEVLKDVYDACELDGTVATHSLRKTFAERVREHSGGDLATIKEMLGHKNIQSTQHYLGVSQSDMDSIIDAL